MIDMVWLMKAIEAVKAGETERLEKDGVIVYKPKADVSVRIDIKNKHEEVETNGSRFTVGWCHVCTGVADDCVGGRPYCK